MNKLREAAANVLLYGMSYAALGSVAALGADAVHGHISQVEQEDGSSTLDFAAVGDRLKTKEYELKSAETALVGHYETRTRLTNEYGRACISLLGAYVLDGPLNDVEEPVAVANMVNSDESACGRDSTDVQIRLRTWRGFVNGLAASQKATQELPKEIKTLRQEDKDDNNFDAWKWGGGIFGLFGAAFGKKWRNWT